MVLTSWEFFIAQMGTDGLGFLQPWRDPIDLRT
jgi:hypothetical protein